MHCGNIAYERYLRLYSPEGSAAPPNARANLMPTTHLTHFVCPSDCYAYSSFPGKMMQLHKINKSIG